MFNIREYHSDLHTIKDKWNSFKLLSFEGESNHMTTVQIFSASSLGGCVCVQTKFLVCFYASSLALANAMCAQVKLRCFKMRLQCVCKVDP